jgi:hypothetical protein
VAGPEPETAGTADSGQRLNCQPSQTIVTAIRPRTATTSNALVPLEPPIRRKGYETIRICPGFSGDSVYSLIVSRIFPKACS